MTKLVNHPASFRDESGYIYHYGKDIFRSVNKVYREDYDFLLSSGLYDQLVSQKLLIAHREIDPADVKPLNSEVYKIIKPRPLPFISYPYEWCYSQIWEAAKLTLLIEKTSLKYRMTLKDASSYNVQFWGTQPVFIDTLSFIRLKKNSPWVAYRQFCQHFLSPLVLMKYRDFRLGKLSQLFLDGVDLDLAVKMLPLKSYFNFHLFLHLFLHSLGQKYLSKRPSAISAKKITGLGLENLIESMRCAVNSLSIKKEKSFWSGYYEDNNYSASAFKNKIAVVISLIRNLKPKWLIDLVSNTGLFSRLTSRYSQYVISIDNDPHSVEENFLRAKKEKINNLMPLLADIINPSPSIGWRNFERQKLLDRLPVDTTLVLALIHHLYFSYNLSFPMMADFFAACSRNLIIEYIPITDGQVQQLINLRTGQFSNYSEDKFVESFSRYFVIKKNFPLKGSLRSIYLLRKK